MADNISLFQRHSFAACVNEGYKFFFKQLPLISRVFLPYLTITALFIVLYCGYTVKLNVEMQLNGEIQLDQLAIAILLWTLMYGACCFTLSRFYLMFRRLSLVETPTNKLIYSTRRKQHIHTLKRTTHLFIRLLPYSIWLYLLYMPAFSPISMLNEWISTLPKEWMITATVVIVLIAILLIIFCTPLLYTLACRMMKPSLEAKIDKDLDLRQFDFKLAYKQAFHHKGKTFWLSVWTSFLFCVSSAIIILPGIICVYAYFRNIEGMVNFGDTATIPLSGYATMLVIGTLAVTLSLMLAVPAMTSAMYLFGDIYTRGTEKTTEKQ